MSLLLTFMELDKLYEATMSRQDLIAHIKASGRNYNLDRRPTDQLAKIWQRIQKEDNEKAGMQEYRDIIDQERARLCKQCGRRLTDGGKCASCSEDEADYIFDETLFEWVDSKGNKVQNTTTSSAQSSATPLKPPAAVAGNVVTIVYDSSRQKLRAQADDGVHGRGYVAFPNNLRTAEGQQYEVETLIWNGKNYRVSGSITPI
jgi:hypothetical protein